MCRGLLLFLSVLFVTGCKVQDATALDHASMTTFAATPSMPSSYPANRPTVAANGHLRLRRQDMLVGPEGDVWTWSRRGVIRWHLSDGTFTRYSIDDRRPDHVEGVTVSADGQVLSLEIHPAGTIYVATDVGRAEDVLTFMTQAPDGDLWVGTSGHGLLRYQDGHWDIINMEDGLASDEVVSIYAAPDGGLWFTTRGRGVSRFDGQVWQTFTVADGLVSNTILSVVAASDGGLWFVGEESGLTRFDGQRWQTHTVEDGLPSERLRYLGETPDGALWWTTETSDQLDFTIIIRYRSGLWSFDGQRWQSHTTEDGSAPVEVSSMLTTVDGATWFSTMKGALRYDGESWTRHGDAWFHSLALSPTGELLAFAYTGFTPMNLGDVPHGTAIYRYDGKRLMPLRLNNRLQADTISFIEKAPDGALWLVLRQGGVVRFDGEEWVTHTFKGRSAVRFMQADGKGNLWFGTSQGLSRFDGEGWTMFTQEDGLPSNQVHSMLALPDGTLWVATTREKDPSGELDFVRFDGDTWVHYP